MDRREFLGASVNALGLSLLAVGCGSSLVSRSLASKKGGTIVTGHVVKDETILTFMDLATGTREEHAIPLTAPHTIYRNYLNPDELFVFEVLGNAVIYNTQTRVSRKVPLQNGSVFAGHATQLGEVIWCTEEQGANRLLRRYSAHDLQPLPGNDQVFRSGHSVVRLPDRPVLVTGGLFDKQGFISFIDSESGKLMRQTSLASFPVHLIAMSPTEVVFSACSTCLLPGKLAACNDADMHPAGNLPEFPHDSLDPIWRVSMEGKAWRAPAALIDPAHQDVVVGGLFMSKISDKQFVTSHKVKDALALWQDGKVQHVFPATDPHDMCVSADGKQLVINGREGLSIYSLENPRAPRQLIPGEKKVLVTCLAPV